MFLRLTAVALSAVLLASLPQINASRNQRLPSIPGQPPDLANMPPGCPFYDRCPHRMPDLCPTREPDGST